MGIDEDAHLQNMIILFVRVREIERLHIRIFPKGVKGSLLYSVGMNCDCE